MAYEHEPIAPTPLAKLIEETVYTPGKHKPPCCPPTIDLVLQLKWGLMVLGEEKATEYLRIFELHWPDIISDEPYSRSEVI